VGCGVGICGTEMPPGPPPKTRSVATTVLVLTVALAAGVVGALLLRQLALR